MFWYLVGTNALLLISKQVTSPVMKSQKQSHVQMIHKMYFSILYVSFFTLGCVHSA